VSGNLRRKVARPNQRRFHALRGPQAHRDRMEFCGGLLPAPGRPGRTGPPRPQCDLVRKRRFYGQPDGSLAGGPDVRGSGPDRPPEERLRPGLAAPLLALRPELACIYGARSIKMDDSYAQRSGPNYCRYSGSNLSQAEGAGGPAGLLRQGCSVRDLVSCGIDQVLLKPQRPWRRVTLPLIRSRGPKVIMRNQRGTGLCSATTSSFYSAASPSLDYSGS
jgi:hypothetical protein